MQANNCFGAGCFQYLTPSDSALRFFPAEKGLADFPANRKRRSVRDFSREIRLQPTRISL